MNKNKSKFVLFCLFFNVLVWKRARDFSLCVAYFLSVIRNAPRGWMKTSLTEWPLLALQTGTIYPFYRFYGYRIALFYGYFFRDFFGPLTSGPLYTVYTVYINSTLYNKGTDASCFCEASGSHSVTELELADQN